MRTLWHIAFHDLRLHLSEKSAVFFLLLMPLGFVFFFSLINSGGSSPNDVRVALPVVDEDQDFLSIAFVEQLRGENFDVEVYTAAEADTMEFRTRVARIPAGFTQTVLEGGEAKIELTKRANSNLQYDLAAEVRLHQTQARFLGNLVRWAAEVDTSASEASGGVQELDRAQMGLFMAMVDEPSRVTVQSGHAGQGRPVPTGMGQSIPGVMVMFVVMTVLIGGSQAITAEKQGGTLRRLATAPLRPSQILLGKTLGLTLLGMAQALILLVMTEALVRLGLIELDFLWSRHWVGLLPLLTAYCVCVATLGLLLSGIFRTTQQAEGLAWLIGMALSGIGGAWWPLEIMPQTMRTVGDFLPTAWAMKGLHSLITFGLGPTAILIPVLILLLMSLVFWVLGSRTLRLTHSG